MGGETFLVAREETREVLGYPAVVTRIPGAKSWVKGLANVRGAAAADAGSAAILSAAARPRPRATRGSSWSITGIFRRV
jgi:twitching motility protein PilI